MALFSGYASLLIRFESSLFADQIHNPSAYVRDYYFFKRSQYPQLNLVHMDPIRAHEALQKQAFVEKMMELGKVQFVTSVLKSSNQVNMDRYGSTRINNQLLISNCREWWGRRARGGYDLLNGSSFSIVSEQFQSSFRAI